MTSTKWLVPTFRNSCSIAASTITNFGKSSALEKLLILVPLYRSEVPDRTRRLWCRDFRSAVLAALAACFLLSPGLPLAEAQAEELRTDAIKIPIAASGIARPLELEAIVVRPDDGQAHPLAVLNHGSPRDS